jgi:hypothetical protein
MSDDQSKFEQTPTDPRDAMPPTSKTAIEDRRHAFLTGGGEVGRLIAV